MWWIVLAMFLSLVLPRTGIAAGRIEISRPDSLTLTILHDNDLHGHLLPFPYLESGRHKVEEPSRGGAARRSTLIQRLRHSIKNPVLLLDSGDVITRGPFWTAYEGEPDIEAMNAIGYDLAAIGNNEFKIKSGAEENDTAGAQADLLQIIKHSRFPWVCANVTDAKGEFLEGVQPYVVRIINGVRVGFLGLTAPRSATYPQTRGWTITDPTICARQWIPIARQHCDVLIAVTHIGVDLDRDLAKGASGLDAIVGGDSHTFLYQAVEVPNTAGVPVPIVQDGEFGVDLGRFDLNFRRDPAGQWRLASYHYQLLPVDPTTPPDRALENLLEPYTRPLQEVVGTLPRVGVTAEERVRLTTRLIADAMRTATGSDLAIHPLGDGMFEAFRHREVTRYELYSVLPFDDHAATASLKGREIKALIAAKPKLVLSGPAAASLEDDHNYKVAFVAFEAQGYHIPDAAVQDTGKDLRDAVVDYLKQK